MYLIGKLSQIKMYQQISLKFKAEFLKDRTAKLKLIDVIETEPIQQEV